MQITIHDNFIKLGQALKLSGLVSEGVEAKHIIQNGEVAVNGETETRRGRKLIPGDTFTFIYDLGDSWKHIVTLVDIRPNMYEDTDGDYAGAHLIAGQGACPPEDVGGVYGYADMLKALENSDEDDDERDEYLNWMGREFDPEFFDLHELQNRVDDFQRVIGEARWGFYHL